MISDDRRWGRYIGITFLIIVLIGLSAPLEARPFRQVTIFGDTLSKKVQIIGDTPAVKFGNGTDTYGLFQTPSGPLRLEQLNGDTNILEADTTGRVRLFHEPSRDSDAVSKNYVDQNRSDTRLKSAGDGSDTVSKPDTALFRDGLDLVDLGGGKFALDATGSGGDTGVEVADGGVFLGAVARLNFGTDLSVSCTNDTCTIDSTASGGGGSGTGDVLRGEIVVDGDTTFTNIVTAFNNAKDGSRIAIGPGTFSPGQAIIIDTGNLTVEGAGMKNTTIDAGSENDVLDPRSGANGLTVRHLELTNSGSGGNDFGVIGGQGDMRFEYLKINTAAQCIDINGGTTYVIDHVFCEADRSGFDFAGGGDELRITNSYINTSGSGPAIDLGSANIYIVDGNIVDDNYGNGVSGGSSDQGVITSNYLDHDGTDRFDFGISAGAAVVSSNYVNGFNTGINSGNSGQFVVGNTVNNPDALSYELRSSDQFLIGNRSLNSGDDFDCNGCSNVTRIANNFSDDSIVQKNWNFNGNNILNLDEMQSSDADGDGGQWIIEEDPTSGDLAARHTATGDTTPLATQ